MSDSILFSCPECSHQMKLPASTVGKQGKCPSCGNTVLITAPPSDPMTLEPAPPIQNNTSLSDQYMAQAQADVAELISQPNESTAQIQADAIHSVTSPGNTGGSDLSPTQKVITRYADFLRNAGAEFDLHGASTQFRKFISPGFFGGSFGGTDAPADILHERTAVTCDQCGSSFGSQMRCDGTKVACNNCGRLQKLPLIETSYLKEMYAAQMIEDEEDEGRGRRRKVIIIAVFTAVAVPLLCVFLARFFG